MLFLLVSLLSIASHTGFAGELTQKKSAKEVINQIMLQNDFKTEEKDYHWVLKNLDNNEDQEVNETWVIPEEIIQAMAYYAKYILWLILLIVFYLVYKNRYLFTFSKITLYQEQHITPNIHSTTVAPDTISNPLPQFQALYTTNNQRAAFSLLYRWIITFVHQKTGIQITQGQIEPEIQNLSEAFEASTAGFIVLAVNKWEDIAYHNGHVTKDEYLFLCQQWEEILSQ